MATTTAATADSLNRHHVAYDNNIRQILRNGVEFEAALTPVVCERTYSAPNVSHGDVIQAYQSGFTPKNDVTFDAVESTLQSMKIDIQYTPDEIDQFRDQWKTEWDELGKSRLDYTFPKWMYSTVIMPKITEELANISFNGQRVAPTVGQPGVTIEAADGFRKRVNDWVTDGSLTPIATGAIVQNTAVAQVEDFINSLPIAYRKASGIVYMSFTNKQKYLYDYRAKFGHGVGLGGNENRECMIYGTTKKIVALQEMEGTDAMFFSPAGNVICGKKRGQANMPVIRWQEFERVLKGLAEFDRFWSVKYKEELFVNDQFGFV